MRILTFDTTLRDGTQGEAVSFSADDKLLVLNKLDELGIDYVEGGWPGSNPKDKDFFARAKDFPLKHTRLTAFGSTRLARKKVGEDLSLNALVDAGTPVVCIFGKSWDLHVHRALNISENENLQLISDTVRYLKAHGKEVLYDAEHFFDGYRASRDFALRTLEAAKSAGADVLCLCATPTAARSPAVWREICADVRKKFDGVLGIHTHNDSESGRRQRARRRRAGIRARAGLHERIRRALRQRQSHVDHRQSGIEDGPHHHRQGALGNPDRGRALHRRPRRICPAQGSALRRPQRLRAQGRRTRKRRDKGIPHVRAR